MNPDILQRWRYRYYSLAERSIQWSALKDNKGSENWNIYLHGEDEVLRWMLKSLVFSVLSSIHVLTYVFHGNIVILLKG